MVSLLVFVALTVPAWRIKGKVGLSGILPFLGLALALIVIARGSREQLFAYPVLLASFLLLPMREDHESGERESLALGVFIYSILVYLEIHVPSFWYFIHSSGLRLSALSGRMIGQDYLLGQTAAGVPVLLLFLSYYCAVAISARRGGIVYLIKCLVLSLAVQAAVLALLTPLAILIQAKAPSWDLLLFNPSAFVFAGLLLPLLVRKPERRPSREGGYRFGLIIALGIISLVLSIFVTIRPSPGTGTGRITILDKGYLNWNVPFYGKYGHKSGGMFGYLPKLLRACGYDVEISDEIGRESLSGTDALVVINVLEYFSEEEKESVVEFVRGGGGLLALGDHTGVKGIRGPFNDLLEPFGIEFIFDSATFLSKGWGEETDLFPHPITHGLYSPHEMDIWVGAGLGVTRPARPVVLAKYGFSDIGSITAFERAYLGNRIFDPGEQLGDLVLAALSDFGKGRVLVFGDTSSFQNGAMVTSYRFVSRVASWLTSGGSYGPWRTLILPLLALVIAVTAAVRRDMLALGVIGASLLIGTTIGLVPRRMERSVPLEMPTAVIDDSHFGRFNKLTWFDDCCGGLQYNLMRGGYFPLMMQRFEEDQIMGSDILVFMAPVRPFSAGEIDVMERFMEKGGWILYACGFDEADGSRGFLEHMGLKVLDVPLTNFTDSLGVWDVRVNKGWGIEVAAPGARIIAERFGYPYMVELRRGRGGIILIADSTFLLNQNLEAMNTYFKDNVHFFKELLERIRGEPGAGPAGSDEKQPGVRS